MIGFSVSLTVSTQFFDQNKVDFRLDEAGYSIVSI